MPGPLRCRFLTVKGGLAAMLTLVFAALGGCAASSGDRRPDAGVAAVEKVPPEAFLAVRSERAAHVHGILGRLVLANAVHCRPDTRMTFGILLLAEAAGSDVQGLRIASVIPTAPASRDISVGDRLAWAGGYGLASSGEAAAASVLSRLARERAGPTRAVAVTREGRQRQVDLTPVEVCDVGFSLLPESGVTAAYRDREIMVSTHALDIFADDDELAFALAHELAHVILNHDTYHGGFDGWLRSMVVPGEGRRLETDADVLGCWLMARAGFDVAAAPRAIARLARLDAASGGMLSESSHPPWVDRLAAVDAAVTDVRAVTGNADGLRIPRLVLERAL